MLQELVLAAVNEATRRVDEELSKQVKDLTGGIPDMMGMKIPGPILTSRIPQCFDVSSFLAIFA